MGMKPVDLWRAMWHKGDRVEVINPFYENAVGKKGTVKKVRKDRTHYRPVIVQMDSGDECSFTFWDLKAIAGGGT